MNWTRGTIFSIGVALGCAFVVYSRAAEMPAVRPRSAEITQADKQFWSFQPVRTSAPENAAPLNESIDRFILQKLSTAGLTAAPEASRAALIRRATFDLHGLPPTPAEVEAFVADGSPDAYEKLVDRLLASRRYGERWARRWLDLVRYAESDGFKQDAYRPAAWPYRDYVIQAFNEDKPYDRFIAEQLAGDELAPNDPRVLVATGFLRHTPYEYNQRDVPKQWSETLNDVTDVTADVFLGLSISCARCHDHKFDPIPQSDYYRLQAFFAPMLPRDDVVCATSSERAAFEQSQQAWETKTASLRAQLADIEAPFIRKTAEIAVAKFPPQTQALLSAPVETLKPLEIQLAWLASRQVYDPDENPQVKISDKPLAARQQQLEEQLAAFDTDRPSPLQRCQAIHDVGRVAPTTVVAGDVKRPVEPGTPAVLSGEGRPSIEPIIATAISTGRRLALAKWIAHRSNPLAARVMVNRIWQARFGRGLVATASDFGALGERPSHPELLDWLARRFVDGNWSIKSIDRMILLSATYRQSGQGRSPASARRLDPDNRLLWRMTPRRLDAEQLRDAMLCVSGELSKDAGGPPAEASQPRRSIYIKMMRNQRDRVLDAFDAPESFCSVASRSSTTTATQSLLLMNGEWPLKRAAAFARRVRNDPRSADPTSRVDTAYRIALGRPPEQAERARAERFIDRSNANAPGGAGADSGLVDFCHVLLNSNEFLYVE